MKTLISVALATAAAIAFSAAPAQAHYGDWWEQYHATKAAMTKKCQQSPGCGQIRYEGSGPYTAHSRGFFWAQAPAGSNPRWHDASYWIGHTNGIFAMEWYGFHYGPHPGIVAGG